MNISRLSPFFCGRCCPSSASSLVIKGSMPRRFLSALRSKLSVVFRAVGSSSWSVIARQTRRAAPLSPPTSRAATDQLTSRGSRLSCTDDPPAGSRSPFHCGRLIRSDLGSISSSPKSITMYSGGTSGTSVMFVDSQVAQLNNPGMQPCSTTTVEHACALCQDQTVALHMFCDTRVRKLLGQGACETSK